MAPLVIYGMRKVLRGNKVLVTHVVVSQIIVGILQTIVQNCDSHAATSYPQSVEGKNVQIQLGKSFVRPRVLLQQLIKQLYLIAR